jgi:hypothetical protein
MSDPNDKPTADPKPYEGPKARRAITRTGEEVVQVSLRVSVAHLRRLDALAHAMSDPSRCYRPSRNATLSMVIEAGLAALEQPHKGDKTR